LPEGIVQLPFHISPVELRGKEISDFPCFMELGPMKPTVTETMLKRIPLVFSEEG
jgi:hypothetical protein